MSIVTPGTSPARPWRDRHQSANGSSPERDRGSPARGGFDEMPLFRRSDPETSRAAGTNARRFARGHEGRILAALAQGPGTKDEVAARCGLTDQQVIRRMAELRRKGFVAAGGENGLSGTGNRETVWQLTDPAEGCSTTAGSGPAGSACSRS